MLAEITILIPSDEILVDSWIWFLFLVSFGGKWNWLSDERRMNLFYLVADFKTTTSHPTVPSHIAIAIDFGTIVVVGPVGVRS